MDTEHSGNGLHLPDLRIDGFRCVDNLSIQRLGRVTLIAGANGVGKTTLLNAVRVYAARGRPEVLQVLLEESQEFDTIVDENGNDFVVPNRSMLFHRDKIKRSSIISIGPKDPAEQLHMELTLESKSVAVPTGKFHGAPVYNAWDSIGMRFGDKKTWMPWDLVLWERTLGQVQAWHSQQSMFRYEDWPSAIECASLGPGPVRDALMARLWDRIALTDSEDLPIRALQLVVDRPVSRVAVVGNENSRYGDRAGRRVVVRLRDGAEPVPLRSLGDGAVRLFGVAVALTNCRDGFLTIDEAENGIHYSVQRDFWRMVMRVAHEANVQVLATTHSWDCVKGFAQASLEFGDAQGVLIRLERDDEGTRAVEYSEEDLEVAAEQGIEVR